jgi:plasmid maintenance system antidote protein VapI
LRNRRASHWRDAKPLANGRAYTADTALRLAKALGTTAQLWLSLQNDYDVQIAKRDLGKILDRIEIVNKPKAA